MLYIAPHVEYPRRRSGSRNRPTNAPRARDSLLRRSHPARRESPRGLLQPAAAARGRARRARALRGRGGSPHHLAAALLRPPRTARARAHPPRLDRAARRHMRCPHRRRVRAARGRRHHRALRRHSPCRLGGRGRADGCADADPGPVPAPQRQPDRRLLDGAPAGSGRRGRSSGAARASLRRQLAQRSRAVRSARDRRSGALAAAGRAGADCRPPRAALRLSQPRPLLVARGLLRPAVDGLLLRSDVAADDPPARRLLRGCGRLAPGARERSPTRPGAARSRHCHPSPQPAPDAVRGHRGHGRGIPRSPASLLEPPRCGW